MSERPPFPRGREGWRCLLAGFAVLASLGLVAAEKPAPAPEEARTHSVFVGIDLSVTIDGQPRRVLGVSKSTAEVEVGTKVRRLRPEELRGFVFNRNIKVSRESVDLDEIRVEPGFRSGGVVDQAWAQAMQTQWIGKTIMEIAEGREDIENQPPRIREMLKEYENMQGGKAMMQDLAKRQIEAGDVEHVALENEARSRSFFDALDVRFLASAPVPVFDCYAVMIFTIRVGGVKSQVAQLLFFCELGAVGPERRPIKAQFSGVPPGFQFLRAEFHVYSRNRELATNVSPNRVMLNERQANQFAVLQYVMAHKGESTAAKASLTPLMSDELSKLAGKEMNLNLRFEIAATGEVKGISGSSPTKALHDYISSIQFYPALDNGKAISSTLNISLGELLR